VFRGVDATTNPLPQASAISAPPQPDFGADATPLVKEDPIGDAVVGSALAGPIGDVAGTVAGKMVGKAAPIVRRIVQPSLKGAAEGAAISGIPTLVRTGSPYEAGKAALEGAAVGGVLGHAAHSVGGIVGKALREKAANATEEAAAATEAAHAAEVGAPVGGVSDQPHPALTPTVEQHLTTLAGSAGPAGVEALKAVALRPSLDTLHAAVKAGVPSYIALQVARLGHSGAVLP
jgi:hypothetical protein